MSGERSTQTLTWFIGEARRHLEAALADEPPGAPTAKPAGTSSTFEDLSRRLNLTGFEQLTLALAVGASLDPEIGRLCAAFNGDAKRPFMTLSMALNVLPDAHWDALGPAGPLRHYGLLLDEPGDWLHRSFLPSEALLLSLLGLPDEDPALGEVGVALPGPVRLSPGRQAFIDDLEARSREHPDFVIQLRADRAGAGQEAAAALAESLGRPALLVAATALAGDTPSKQARRLAARRAQALRGVLIVVEVARETADVDLELVLRALDGALVLLSDHPLRLAARPVLVVDVPSPKMADQRRLWRSALSGLAPDTPGPAELRGWLDRLATTFEMTARDIAAASQAAKGPDGQVDFERLWTVCRAGARSQVGQLVQVIEPRARLDQLVLPKAGKVQVTRLVERVRLRYRVYVDWDLPRSGAQGTGAVALFAGPSGTGKTLAAEAVAHALSVDLYRVELSTVVSKYIGETEKHLDAVFAAAERTGAVLLFDEADALFGKRSQVSDARDRYANLEVSYLLQRLERYRGLAILTSNLPDSLDTAFRRRLAVSLVFSFPGFDEREAIWRLLLSLPDGIVSIEDSDYARLARLTLAGGDIRSVATQAAFFAAAGDGQVTMQELRRAVEAEFGRQGRPLLAAERWW